MNRLQNSERPATAPALDQAEPAPRSSRRDALERSSPKCSAPPCLMKYSSSTFAVFRTADSALWIVLLRTAARDVTVEIDPGLTLRHGLVEGGFGGAGSGVGSKQFPHFVRHAVLPVGV